jgi:hypothetical protein
MSCTYLYDAVWIVLVKLDERPIHMYKCAEIHGQCRGGGLWNQDERDVHTRRVDISFMNVKRMLVEYKEGVRGEYHHELRETNSA